MLVAVAIFGVATVVFGISKNIGLSLFALVVTGAADMVSVVIRLTLVQLSTPAAMRGRVSAVNMAFINASNELGEFESGVTAALLGTVPAVVLGGVGTCAVVALWTWLFPQLSKLDRLVEAIPPAPDEATNVPGQPSASGAAPGPGASPSSPSLDTAEASTPPSVQPLASKPPDRSR